MSRLFKSQQCQEALPCRLEPVDMDSFFINEPEEPAAPPDQEELGEAVTADSEDSPEAALQLLLAQAEENVKRARQEAEEIRALARSQAEEIRTQAKREGDRLAEQAREAARQAGRREGFEAGRQDWAARIATALSLVEQGEACIRERVTESEPEILRLAQAIAEKIIGAELELAPLQKLQILRGALQRVTTASSISIRVCPGDQTLLEENLTYLQEIFNAPKPLQVLPDQTLRGGDFFIETELGTVDPRIKQQLERIMAEIFKAGPLQ